MDLIDYRHHAQEVARRRDAQLVALIAQALEPWPVRVLLLEDNPDVLRIVLGATTALDVPIDPTLRNRLPLDELVLAVAREARHRWRNTAPLDVPDKVILATD